MEHLIRYEDFMVEKIMNEEELVKADQSQIMKKIARSFDNDDLKLYLQGMMLDLDITTRKKYKKLLDDGKYRELITFLIKGTSDPLTSNKLLAIKKEFLTSKGESTTTEEPEL